jgi:hypothetical protein
MQVLSFEIYTHTTPAYIEEKKTFSSFLPHIPLRIPPVPLSIHSTTATMVAMKLLTITLFAAIASAQDQAISDAESTASVTSELNTSTQAPAEATSAANSVASSIASAAQSSAFQSALSSAASSISQRVATSPTPTTGAAAPTAGMYKGM